MNINDLMADQKFKDRFVKSAQAEIESLVKSAQMTPVEKSKRLAYLKGVLHDIFLENR